jgi:hypothetical protein
MKSEIAGHDVAAPSPARQPRCDSCGGVIDISPDQDISPGLNLALGLVSDECALVCNGCTSRLIAAREAEKLQARGRR